MKNNTPIKYIEKFIFPAKIINNSDDNTENHGDENIENILCS